MLERKSADRTTHYLYSRQPLSSLYQEESMTTSSISLRSSLFFSPFLLFLFVVDFSQIYRKPRLNARDNRFIRTRFSSRFDKSRIRGSHTLFPKVFEFPPIGERTNRANILEQISRTPRIEIRANNISSSWSSNVLGYPWTIHLAED